MSVCVCVCVYTATECMLFTVRPVSQDGLSFKGLKEQTFNIVKHWMIHNSWGGPDYGLFSREPHKGSAPPEVTGAVWTAANLAGVIMLISSYAHHGLALAGEECELSQY